MRNARLDELQAGIKIGERKGSNLGHVDDPTLMAESKEEGTKEPLDEVEGREWKNLLKLTIKKQKQKQKQIMVSAPIIAWQLKGKMWK